MDALIFDIETEPCLRPDQVDGDAKAAEIGGARPTTTKLYKEWEAGQRAAGKSIVTKAALRADAGRVLCVGERTAAGFGCTADAGEAVVLACTWDNIESVLDDGCRVIGHNIFGFDLPFLVRRSRILGVKVPSAVWNHSGNPRYPFNNLFRCTMDAWALGTRDTISLDNLSKALGVGGKNGSGADFAALWHQNREEAIAYLKNDLELTRACAEKLGLLEV